MVSEVLKYFGGACDFKVLPICKRSQSMHQELKTTVLLKEPKTNKNPEKLTLCR